MHKILVFSRIYPYSPAYGGDISYSRGILQSLALSANVTALVGGNGEVLSGEYFSNGVSWIIAGAQKKGMLKSLVSTYPLIAWRGISKEYVDAAEKLLKEDWSAIVIDHIGSSHVLSLIEKYKRLHPNVNLVYMSHEHEASVRREKYSVYGGGFLKRLAMKYDGTKVSRLEAKIIDSVDYISVINSADIPLYKLQRPNAKFLVMTPGFDSKAIKNRDINETVPRRVVILGGRGSKQKQVILERWLDIAGPIFESSGVEMVVVGPIDSELKNRLETRHSSVKFHGFVDDLDQFLASCRIGVVPDFVGGGFKVRLLTYVFNAIPMFSIKNAISGLPIKSGEGFAEYESLKELALGICANVDNYDYLNSIQHAAVNACDGEFDWADRGQAFIGRLFPA